jgi:hypothetical protein
VLLGRHTILSTSGDLALHYQLVDVFQHGLSIPAPAIAYLDRMAVEPNLAHRLAGLLAWAGFPGFSALSVLGVAAAALVWLTLFDRLRRISAWAVAVGALLSFLGARLLGAVHGGEVMENFFYPQMVAEAFFVTCAVAGAVLLQRSRWLFVGFAVASTIVCGFIHTLPAIKLAGTFMALLAFDAAFVTIRLRKPPPVACLVGLVALPASIVLNPCFTTMVGMAAAWGGIWFRYPIGFAALIPAELVLGALAISVLLRDLLRWSPEPGSPENHSIQAARLLSCMAAAAAAGGLGQFAFLQTGAGSPYAVLKHAFGVFSLLCLMVPVAIWAWRRDRTAEPSRGVARPRGPWVAVAAQSLLIGYLFVRPSHIDIDRTARLLDDARQARLALGLAPGSRAAVFASDTLPPGAAFAMNIVALRSSKSSNAMGVLFNGNPIEPEHATWILTEAGDKSYDIAACRRGPPFGALVVVEGACVAPPELAFGKDGAGLRSLGPGWSRDPASGEVRLVAPQASLDLPLPPRTAQAPRAILQLALRLAAATPGAAGSLHVRLAGVAGEAPVLNGADPRDRVFLIELPPGVRTQRQAHILVDAGAPALQAKVVLRAIRLVPRSAGELAGA